MNKSELVEAVASRLGESKASAARFVDAVVESITNGLKEQDAVTIVGFGTFSKKNRPARMGRNPITGEPIKIKPSTTVGFKPSQGLKQSL
jgi:nucleoid DNA-binding protein